MKRLFLLSDSTHFDRLHDFSAYDLRCFNRVSDFCRAAVSADGNNVLLVDAASIALGWSRQFLATAGQGRASLFVMSTVFNVSHLSDALPSGAVAYVVSSDSSTLLNVMSERSHLGDSSCEDRRRISDRRKPVLIADSTRAMFAKVSRLAASDATVLISGESGSGKELVAQAIFITSFSHGLRYVTVNCGALADTVLESELFGHRRGAFTGALEDRPGLLAEANGGTIFLDEVGELSLSAQTRLLRFLDSGEVRRVGDDRTRRLNVRVIAATNRDLKSDVLTGRFRADLYYRLSRVTIRVPALRERRSDIAALAADAVEYCAASLHRPLAGITSEALTLLSECNSWPGNIRQLLHTIESACIFATGTMIGVADLLAVDTFTDSLNEYGGLVDQALLRAVSGSDGGKAQTAASLGISRTTLWRRNRKNRVSLQTKASLPTKRGRMSSEGEDTTRR